jgi:2-isopropylmalate synthase
VDVIEAGFPIASPGDFEAVQAIAREVEGPVIAGLARAHTADVERAAAAVRDAERPRIHTFISTSDIHIEHQLRSTREDVKAGARAAVAHAKSFVEDVEFSPMDATRADVEFTAEVLQIALDEGATTINIPDTVGYAMPQEYAAFLGRLYALVPDLRKAVLSVHCHDDLGLAVANSFAGVLAGARQVECAINGIGERAGNASLEEVVMLLHTRAADVGIETGVNTREIARTSRLISRLTGYPVQPNKAVVGRNAFAHESGHPPGRRAQGALHLRDHGRAHDRPRRQRPRARQALGPPRAQGRARGPRLRSRGPRAQPGVQALQGDRGQEEAGDRDGSRGARHRRAARRGPRVHARVVRGPGVVQAPAARAGRRAHARGRGGRGRLHRRRPGRRDLPGDQRRHGPRRAPARVPRRLGHGRPGRPRRGSVVLEIAGLSASGQGVSTDIIESAAHAYVRALSNADLRGRRRAAQADAGSGALDPELSSTP